MRRYPSSVDVGQHYLPSPGRSWGTGAVQARALYRIQSSNSNFLVVPQTAIVRPRELSSSDCSMVKYGSSSAHGGNSTWRGCHPGMVESKYESPPPRTHGYARFAPVHPRPGFCNLVIEWQGSPSPQTYHPMTDARTARNMGVEVRGLGRARNIVAHHVVRPYSSCHFAKVAS